MTERSTQKKLFSTSRSAGLFKTLASLWTTYFETAVYLLNIIGIYIICLYQKQLGPQQPIVVRKTVVVEHHIALQYRVVTVKISIQ